MYQAIALGFVILASAASSASGQQWANKMFEESTHDFGQVAMASKAQYRFTFKNLYKEDVHIAGVSASCKCLAPSVSKTTLKTFETGEVVVDFNTRSFVGQRNATVKIVFDKPYYAEVRLELSGYIRTDVVFDPPQVDLGQVDQGSTVEKKVTVRFAGRRDWEIADVTSTNANFEVEKSEPKRNGDRTEYELTVRLKETAPAGYIQDHLTLVTNGQSPIRIPLCVEGRISPKVAVSPATLFIGEVKPGDKVSKLLIVRGKTPFKVTDVACDDACFKFTVDDEQAPLHRIPVEFTAPEKPGEIKQTIRIKTDQGDEIVVECSAWAKVVAAN